jgi:hypothetical protein
MNKRIADLLVQDTLKRVRVNYSKDAEAEARIMLEAYRKEFGEVEQRNYMDVFVGILRKRDMNGNQIMD